MFISGLSFAVTVQVFWVLIIACPSMSLSIAISNGFASLYVPVPTKSSHLPLVFMPNVLLAGIPITMAALGMLDCFMPPSAGEDTSGKC